MSNRIVNNYINTYLIALAAVAFTAATCHVSYVTPWPGMTTMDLARFAYDTNKALPWYQWSCLLTRHYAFSWHWIYLLLLYIPMPVSLHVYASYLDRKVKRMQAVHDVKTLADLDSLEQQIAAWLKDPNSHKTVKF